MFRIVCDPSSGSMVLYLTEIIHSGSQMYSTTGCSRAVPARCTIHTHHWFKITLPNTDQAHDKHL